MPRPSLPTPPSPHKGPLVAGGDIDWWNNACLDPHHPSWIGYADGYLKAARLLVRHVTEARSDQDILVYPIVFLYRQYVELTLKQIVIAYRSFVNDDTPQQYSHSLLEQWQSIPPLFSKLQEIMDQEVLTTSELAETNRLLKEFDSVDRSSETFRYPVRKDGTSSLPQDLTHLNLRRFAEGMDRLAHLLGELVTTAYYFDDYFTPGNEM